MLAFPVTIFVVRNRAFLRSCAWSIGKASGIEYLNKARPMIVGTASLSALLHTSQEEEDQRRRNEKMMLAHDVFRFHIKKHI